MRSEKDLWPKLDAIGEDEVRLRLAKRVYGESKRPLVEEWLRRRETQRASASVKSNPKSLGEVPSNLPSAALQAMGRQAAHRRGPIEIFFSYAHEDEALMDDVRRQLVVRERMGQIVKWHDRMIPAGDKWKTKIDDRIERAHVILLFMSPHFLASRYCYEIEGEIALRRHRDRTARVIPVVLRPCDWTVTPFGELQALPRDAVPITQWPDRDQASLDVARGIMDSIQQVPDEQPET